MEILKTISWNLKIILSIFWKNIRILKKIMEIKKKFWHEN